MRRAGVIGLVALVALMGCTNPRGHARDQFIAQLQQEGGVPHDQAVCIVDQFFSQRTTEELKAFFERKDLTDAERAEFARLGQLCATFSTTTPTN